MGLMGFVSKLSSVICHESLSGHNISLSCNNMPLLNDYGWLLFTQKSTQKEPSLLCTNELKCYANRYRS